MTLLSVFSLATIMVVLAAIPSASVALVVARSVGHGIRNGAAVAAGIVLGDLVFVLLALLGLSVLAETMGAFFSILRYVGGGYLIWLGWRLVRVRPDAGVETTDFQSRSIWVSFGSGFLLTLGDVKAIFFYASLFPSILDIARMSYFDMVVIGIVTVVCVGSVKLAYAFFARQILKRWSSSKIPQTARPIAGGILAGTGVYLIAKS